MRNYHSLLIKFTKIPDIMFLLLMLEQHFDPQLIMQEENTISLKLQQVKMCTKAKFGQEYLFSQILYIKVQLTIG